MQGFPGMRQWRIVRWLLSAGRTCSRAHNGMA